MSKDLKSSKQSSSAANKESGISTKPKAKKYHKGKNAVVSTIKLSNFSCPQVKVVRHPAKSAFEKNLELEIINLKKKICDCRHSSQIDHIKFSRTCEKQICEKCANDKSISPIKITRHEKEPLIPLFILPDYENLNKCQKKLPKEYHGHPVKFVQSPKKRKEIKVNMNFSDSQCKGKPTEYPDWWQAKPTLKSKHDEESKIADAYYNKLAEFEKEYFIKRNPALMMNAPEPETKTETERFNKEPTCEDREFNEAATVTNSHYYPNTNYKNSHVERDVFKEKEVWLTPSLMKAHHSRIGVSTMVTDMFQDKCLKKLPSTIIRNIPKSKENLNNSAGSQKKCIQSPTSVVNIHGHNSNVKAEIETAMLPSLSLRNSRSGILNNSKQSEEQNNFKSAIENNIHTAYSRINNVPKSQFETNLFQDQKFQASPSPTNVGYTRNKAHETEFDTTKFQNRQSASLPLHMTRSNQVNCKNSQNAYETYEFHDKPFVYNQPTSGMTAVQQEPNVLNEGVKNVTGSHNRSFKSHNLSWSSYVLETHLANVSRIRTAVDPNKYLKNIPSTHVPENIRRKSFVGTIGIQDGEYLCSPSTLMTSQHRNDKPPESVLQTDEFEDSHFTHCSIPTSISHTVQLSSSSRNGDAKESQFGSDGLENAHFKNCPRAITIACPRKEILQSNQYERNVLQNRQFEDSEEIIATDQPIAYQRKQYIDSPPPSIYSGKGYAERNLLQMYEFEKQESTRSPSSTATSYLWNSTTKTNPFQTLDFQEGQPVKSLFSVSSLYPGTNNIQNRQVEASAFKDMQFRNIPPVSTSDHASLHNVHNVDRSGQIETTLFPNKHLSDHVSEKRTMHHPVVFVDEKCKAEASVFQEQFQTTSPSMISHYQSTGLRKEKVGTISNGFQEIGLCVSQGDMQQLDRGFHKNKEIKNVGTSLSAVHQPEYIAIKETAPKEAFISNNEIKKVSCTANLKHCRQSKDLEIELQNTSSIKKRPEVLPSKSSLISTSTTSNTLTKTNNKENKSPNCIKNIQNISKKIYECPPELKTIVEVQRPPFSFLNGLALNSTLIIDRRIDALLKERDDAKRRLQKEIKKNKPVLNKKIIKSTTIPKLTKFHKDLPPITCGVYTIK